MATIAPLPSGRWRARVRRLRQPTQSASFALKRDAEAWARERESEIERGRWHDNTKAEKTLLADALDTYDTEVVEHMRGKRGERSIVGILRDEPIAKKTLAGITSADLSAMMDRWSEAGLKAGSIRRRMGTLSSLFTKARKKWGMPGLSNPVHEIDLPEDDPSRDRRASEAELDALRSAGKNTAHLREFVTLAVETAMRREELLITRWSDVKISASPAQDGGVLHVRKTKNGTPRDVPLSPLACAVLDGMPHTGPRVFPGWKNPPAATRAFSRARQRARELYVAACEAEGNEPDQNFLMDLRLHDLRHEAISRLAPFFQVHELAKITGHKTIKMLMRYYHPTVADFAKRLAARPV